MAQLFLNRNVSLLELVQYTMDHGHKYGDGSGILDHSKIFTDGELAITLKNTQIPDLKKFRETTAIDSPDDFVIKTRLSVIKYDELFNIITHKWRDDNPIKINLDISFYDAPDNIVTIEYAVVKRRNDGTEREISSGEFKMDPGNVFFETLPSREARINSPPPPISAAAPAAPQKRCPKGTRRNKTTKLCESTAAAAAAAHAAPQKRCPKGTRRNKTTKLCESTTAAAAPPPQHVRIRIREPPLEIIPMSEFTFVRLCGNTTCGGKVMCFIASRGGTEYVLKEGRKTMDFNRDYAAVDECKKIFGLYPIGMRRIQSDHIIEKKDKTNKYWADNWQFTPRDGVIYTMMNVIDGEKLIDVWRKRAPTPAEIREFMKIGIWRGIFGVSDFSPVNIMRRNSDGALISIDEHGILGDRRDIIGKNNRKIYTENAHFMPEIWEDLYKNREKKIAHLKHKLTKYGYSHEILETVIDRYMRLRELVNL